MNHPRQLVLTIFTGGLWAIPWSALCMGTLLRPWRCKTCGWHKPEFRETTCIPVAKPPSAPKKVQPPTVE
ncbi:MAG TPA: hypothetical protein VHY22_15365 [Chthoniobacteraceae bacterium]|nr:hypothetical protein [Chthoniobacteraceae bacterium]